MNNVITGMPRSGTSLMSKLIHDAVGADHFFGQQWRGDDMPADIKDLNIHGFYESEQTCRPIRAQIGNDGDWLKVITPALVGSKSELIGKVIACIRDPLSVAQSRKHMREVVQRVEQNERKSKERPGAGLLTPVQYVSAMGRLTKWVTANKRQMPLIVDYRRIIAEPVKACGEISAYIGATVNPDTIDRTQSRSQPINDGQDWQIANDAYAAILAGDFATVIDLYERHACIACQNKRNRKPMGG